MKRIRSGHKGPYLYQGWMRVLAIVLSVAMVASLADPASLGRAWASEAEGEEPAEATNPQVTVNETPAAADEPAMQTSDDESAASRFVSTSTSQEQTNADSTLTEPVCKDASTPLPAVGSAPALSAPATEARAKALVDEHTSEGTVDGYTVFVDLSGVPAVESASVTLVYRYVDGAKVSQETLVASTDDGSEVKVEVEGTRLAVNLLFANKKVPVGTYVGIAEVRVNGAAVASSDASFDFVRADDPAQRCLFVIDRSDEASKPVVAEAKNGSSALTDANRTTADATFTVRVLDAELDASQAKSYVRLVAVDAEGKKTTKAEVAFAEVPAADDGVPTMSYVANLAPAELADGSYVVEARAEDAAGNVSTCSYPAFTYRAGAAAGTMRTASTPDADATLTTQEAPSSIVVGEVEGLVKAGDTYYLNAENTGSATIHFTASGIDLGSCAAQIDQSVSGVTATLTPADSTPSAINLTGLTALTEGQTYTVQLTPSEGEPLTVLSFTVDKTAPTLTNATLEDAPVGTVVSETGGAGKIVFLKNSGGEASARLKLVAADAGSGLAAPGIVIGTTSSYDVTEAAFDANGFYEISLKEDVQEDTARGADLRVISIAIRDKTGNATTYTLDINSSNTITQTAVSDSTTPLTLPTLTFVKDTTAPTLSLLWRGTAEGAIAQELSYKTAEASAVKNYFNTDVYVSARVVEHNFGYQLTANKTDSATFSVTKDGTSKYSGTLQAFTPGTDPNEYVATTTSALSEDGTYEIASTVTDLAANSTTRESTVVIDKTVPTFKVEWDTVTPRENVTGEENSPLYAGRRTATITVTEANFDASKMSVTVNGATLDPGTEDGQLVWTDGANNTHVAKVSFGSTGTEVANAYKVNDGLEKLEISGTDAAGNAATYAETEIQGGSVNEGRTVYTATPFTVDTTAPVLTVTYTPATWAMSATDEVAFTPREATIKVVEHNWDPNKIDLTGSTYIASANLSWQDEGDAHTATVKLLANTDYSLVLTGKDKADYDLVYDPAAGSIAYATFNESTHTYTSTGIDATPPVIEVSFDKAFTQSGDTKYFNEFCKATITVTEKNLLDSGLSVVVDGTATTPTWTPGENNTYITTIENLAEGEHTFVVEGTDTSGNTGTSTTKLRIDTTPPAIVVAFDNNAAHNADGKHYYKAGRTATVAVTDNSFDASLFRVGVSQSGTSNVPQYSITGPTSDGTTHTYTIKFEKDGTYTLTAVGKDLSGNRATYKADDSSDAAHNGGAYDPDDGSGMAGYQSLPFVVDQTIPAVEVTSTDSGFTHDAKTNRDYYNDVRAINIRVADRNLVENTAAVKVNGRIYTNIAWKEQQVDAGSVTLKQWGRSTADDATVTYTATIVYRETPSNRACFYTPTVQVVDKAGNANTAYRSGEQAFVVDYTAPVIDKVTTDTKPTSEGKSSAYQFYNTPTTMSVTLSDHHAIASAAMVDKDGIYNFGAAIAESSDELKDRNSATLSFSLKDGTTNSRNTEFDNRATFTAADVAGNARTWTVDKTGAVLEQHANKKSRPVTNVSLRDEGIYPTALIQDQTKPTIALSPIDIQGGYFNTTQTVNVAVNEFNFAYLQLFDPGRVIFTVNKQEGTAGRAASSWTHSAADFSGEASNWAFTQAFESDGHYSIVAQFTDYANNTSEQVSLGEFTIDKTAPTCTISWDNSSAENGKYYKSTRTATITVHEHNFDASRISVTTNGTQSGWTHDGDTHTMTVGFSAEGTYNLSVEGTDLAGNGFQKLTEPEFVVDYTQPKVDLALAHGTENEQREEAEPNETAWNDPTIAVIMRMSDTNYNGGGISKAEVVGTNTGTRFVEGPSYGEGNTTARFDIRNDVGADDIYMANVELKDLAGNASTASFAFSVNRYGSTWRVRSLDVEDPEGDGDLHLTLESGAQLTSVVDQLARANNGIIAASPRIVVEEINVTGAADSDRHVKVTNLEGNTSMGQAVRELKQVREATGAGYELRDVSEASQESLARQGMGGWDAHEYVIHADSFGEATNKTLDGRYIVSMSSTDRAKMSGGEGNNNSIDSYYSRALAVADKSGYNDSYLKADDNRNPEVIEGCEVKFTRDSTGPQVLGLGNPGFAIDDEMQLSFTLEDDVQAPEGDAVSVLIATHGLFGGAQAREVNLKRATVNGETKYVDAHTGKEVEGIVFDGDKTFTITVPKQSFATKTVEVAATDYANRSSTASTGAFYVSSLRLEIGLGVVVIAAVTAAIVVVRKRNERANQEFE